MWVGHWAVLLFLIVVPGCASLFDVGAHDMARIAQIIVCTLAALAIWWRAAIGQSEKRLDSALAVALGVGVFVALLSVWHASDSTAAMRELALLLGLFSIAAVVGCSCRRDALEVMAVVVAAAALLNAGLVLTLMLGTVLQLNRLDLFTVVPGYDNPRFLNHVQTVMLPLSAIAASPSFRRGEFSRLGWTAMALNFALIFFTQGRATGLALLGASLLARLLFGRAAVPMLLRLVVAAAVGFVIHGVLFVLIPSLMGTLPEPWRPVADTGSFQERLKLWGLAVDYLAREPWLGIGPMHYAHHLNPIAAHPHNVYLQIASEWGLPMLLGLFICAGWALRQMARAIVSSTDTEQVAMGIAIFCALIAVAIDGMLSGNFVMPVSQVWIAFAAGWAIAWTRFNTSSTAALDGAQWPRPVGAVCCVFALASQAWLWWSIAPEVGDLNLHLNQINTRFLNGVPQTARFWSTGWF